MASRSTPESTAGGSRQVSFPFATYAAVLLIVATVVVTYSNTLHAPFVFDDHSSIRNNLAIRQLWPPRFAEIGGLRGRPLVNASFAVNYAWGRDTVTGYHIVNIAIHATAALGCVCEINA